MSLLRESFPRCAEIVRARLPKKSTGVADSCGQGCRKSPQATEISCGRGCRKSPQASEISCGQGCRRSPQAREISCRQGCLGSRSAACPELVPHVAGPYRIQNRVECAPTRGIRCGTCEAPACVRRAGVKHVCVGVLPGHAGGTSGPVRTGSWAQTRARRLVRTGSVSTCLVHTESTSSPRSSRWTPPRGRKRVATGASVPVHAPCPMGPL